MDSRTYKAYGLVKNEPIVRTVGTTVIMQSPARSPRGNIRNIKAMTDVKLTHLVKKMGEKAPDSRQWRHVDPDAWVKVVNETRARGYNFN